MQEQNTQDNDRKAIFIQKFQERKNVLEQCKLDKVVLSCLKCPNCLGCETRNAYVTAVYQSMSLGDLGGFEF